ncbi:YncE family protein [Archangium lansingense]|uniref:Lipoprotein n=1 Tax=Archangium lansingense TaxID=2995310 RepID=A0ABT4A8C0_9BACT|nr:hypothetical protein [Archangium lansinium]MCY1077182.1 hypothetical protein [Archangium lansinium]
MRPLLLSLALLFTACTQTDERLPPSDRFVYPSGIAYRPGSVSGNTNGVLYVSSANFDRCFDWGSVMAVDLDRVAGSSGEALLPLGSYTDPTAAPAELGQLHIAPESRRYIQSFAGEMALWEPAGASPRLFIPARADGNYLHYIDIPAPTQLSCVGNADADNCIQGALSLTTGISGQQDGLPRAEAPFSVFVDTFGIPNNADKTGARLWVTHLNPADSPELSRLNYETYAVDLSAATPGVSSSDFHPLSLSGFPEGGASSVVADERYVFVTGRLNGNRISDTSLSRRFLVRVLDKQNLSNNLLIEPGLDLAFSASEARGLALTPPVASQPRRLYVAVRDPDSLLIVDVKGIEKESASPSLTVVGAVPLPGGPTQVTLVSRGASRSALVLVSCSDAGVVAIYDPDVGQVVAQVSVGQQSGTQSSQPFGLAFQQAGNAARIFASNFGDGRVSVIDIADLNNPQLARLVAWLGVRQDVGQSAQCQEEQL